MSKLVINNYEDFAAMLGKNVPLITQVQQRPIVMVAAQIDVSATSAVASVRPAVGLVLGAMQVNRTAAALAGAAEDFDVVYEIAFSHLGEIIFFTHYQSPRTARR